MCGLLHSPTVPAGLSVRECGAAGSTSHCLVGSASCSLACPVPQSTPSLGPPAPALLQILSAWLPASDPPTGLDECFFFISLVVGLPYSLIFCQFWLFLFLNCCCPSFGCVRRRSVSTYASILARSLFFLISFQFLALPLLLLKPLIQMLEHFKLSWSFLSLSSFF